jgi:hypothetical protein
MMKKPVASPMLQPDLDAEEELAVGLPSRRAASVAVPPPPAALDLSGKPRVVVLPGRGRVGKTTWIRWAAEQSAAAGRDVILADLDRSNATLSSYFDGVQRPDDGDEATVSRWLERLFQHLGHNKMSGFVDLGGGDTTLPKLAAEIPDLAAAVEGEGVQVVAVYLLGPQTDDLGPLATLESVGFQPAATALILNEGLIPPGETRNDAFARVLRHSTFRSVVERGASLAWMPRIQGGAATEMEAKRLSFALAAAGHSPAGRTVTPLGGFDRARIRAWQADMTREMAGIASWIP